MQRTEKSLIKPITDFFKNQNYITAIEWRTPYAIPDVLAIKPYNKRIKNRLQSRQIISLNKEIYWRILDIIPDKSEGGTVSIEDLSRKLSLSENYLKKYLIRYLERGNYIKYLGKDRITKINGFYPYCYELITIEAKIAKWKKAAEQAIRHRLFSNRTYIALDKKYLHRALKHISSFRKEKIGILAVDDNEGVELVLKAPQIKPRYKYMHYLVLEQFWSRLVKEERVNAS